MGTTISALFLSEYTTFSGVCWCPRSGVVIDGGCCCAICRDHLTPGKMYLTTGSSSTKKVLVNK